MAKKTKKRIIVKVKGKGSKTLTEKLIKECHGTEEPEKLADWMSRLFHNAKSMNFDPYHPQGKYIEGSQESVLKKHYGEK